MHSSRREDLMQPHTAVVEKRILVCACEGRSGSGVRVWGIGTARDSGSRRWGLSFSELQLHGFGFSCEHRGGEVVGLDQDDAAAENGFS